MICGGKICREGLKEVSTRGGEEEWGKDGSMDPQERKQVLAFPFWWVILIFGTISLFWVQVYVATSGRAGGGQGLFAKRQFLPGELISYFSGKKTVEEEFLFDNMTAREEEEAASYYFNLAENSPGWWGVPEGQVGESESDFVKFSRWLIFQVKCEASPNSEQPLATRPTLHSLMSAMLTLKRSDTITGFCQNICN